MDAIAEYNRLVAENADAAREQWEWLQAAFVRAGVTFDGAPMRSFLRPHLVSRPAWNMLRDAGRRLMQLAARAARVAFGGDARRLCDYLGTPEAQARWVRLDPGEPDVVLSRLDAFVTPAGPRFIEVNSDAPAGFGYGDRMAEIFGELPLFRDFAARVPVGYLPSRGRLVEAVLGVWRERRGTDAPGVAIVDWDDVKTRADQEILRQAFEARGVRCVLADPRQMELRKGRLHCPSGPVDLVYRRSVLAELVEREDEVGDFLRAYRDGFVLFVNSFRCHLSEDKAFLALLTDEAFPDLLGEDERAFVRCVVPWTRRLEERKTLVDGRPIDLLPYVLEHRTRLVLKPAHGYGGRSVFVGEETSQEAWEQAVRNGTGTAWTVQERVPIPEETFPVFDAGALAFESLKVNTNPFYVAGDEVGAVTRASRSQVINVSAGGGSVPTFVVG